MSSQPAHGHPVQLLPAGHISREQIGLADADVIFSTAYGDPAEAALGG